MGVMHSMTRSLRRRYGLAGPSKETGTLSGQDILTAMNQSRECYWTIGHMMNVNLWATRLVSGFVSDAKADLDLAADPAAKVFNPEGRATTTGRDAVMTEVFKDQPTHGAEVLYQMLLAETVFAAHLLRDLSEATGVSGEDIIAEYVEIRHQHAVETFGDDMPELQLPPEMN